MIVMLVVGATVFLFHLLTLHTRRQMIIFVVAVDNDDQDDGGDLIIVVTRSDSSDCGDMLFKYHELQFFGW